MLLALHFSTSTTLSIATGKKQRKDQTSSWLVCSSSAFLLFPNRVGNKAKLPKSPDHSPETGESGELFCVQGSPGSGRSRWIRIQEAGSPLLLGSFGGKGKRGDAPKFLVYSIKLTMNMSAMLWWKIFPERCMLSLGIPWGFSFSCSFWRKEAVALSWLACKPSFLITEWGGNGQSTDGSDRKSKFLEGHARVLLPWHWVSLANNRPGKDWDGEKNLDLVKQEPNLYYCCTMHQLYDPTLHSFSVAQFSHLWRGDGRWE